MLSHLQKSNNMTNSKKNNILKFNHKIISLFITNKNKKVILARPFIKMSKRELLHHIGLFWRFLDQDENSKKNHFDLKDEESDFRFVFQTLNTNEIYLVIITRQDFNFFEALDLMRSLHRVISQNLNGLKVEDEIIKCVKSKAFDLFLLIDDIVNPYTGREIYDLQTLTSNLQMESKNEKEFEIVKKGKEEKAREDMIKGMEEIERLKKENKYEDNSISSEKIEMQNNQREMINNMINETRRSLGMNLKERLVQRLLHNREEEMQLGKNNKILLKSLSEKIALSVV
jgi:hypothetical protein